MLHPMNFSTKSCSSSTWMIWSYCIFFFGNTISSHTYPVIPWFIPPYFPWCPPFLSSQNLRFIAYVCRIIYLSFFLSIYLSIYFPMFFPGVSHFLSSHPWLKITLRSWPRSMAAGAKRAKRAKRTRSWGGVYQKWGGTPYLVGFC